MSDERTAYEHAEQHWLYGVIYGELKFCGCGRPEDSLALIVEMLRACPWYEGAWEEFDQRLTTGGFQIVAGVLTEADLIEHGSSVGGSWITEKGKRFLALAGADDFDIDSLDEVGFSCSDCPHPVEKDHYE